MHSGQVLYMEGQVAATDEVREVLNDLHCTIFTVDSVDQAQRLIRQQALDLVILNIEQGENQALLDFVFTLKEANLPIIFLSFDQDRSLYEQAKRADLIAYLVSPVDMLTLRSIVEYNLKKISPAAPQVESKWTPNNYIEDTLFIKVNQLLQKVKINNITHIRSEGNYCMIFTPEKKYAIKISMIRLYNSLSGKGFIQAHKSFLVQLNKIDNIDISSNEVLIGELRIPLGRKYKQELLTCLNLL